MSTKTRISINGVELEIASDTTSEECILSAAKSANDRIKQTMADSPALDSYNAMAFALFRLAGEYEELKYKYERMADTMKQLPGNSSAAAPRRSYNAQRKTAAEVDPVSKK